MTGLIDAELVLRLGALDHIRSERIQEYVHAAVTWRGYSHAEGAQIARAMHWQMVGLDLAAPARDVVTALALYPLPADDHARLVAMLDWQCEANHGSLAVAQDAAYPRSDDYVRVGRRLAHALEMITDLERLGATVA